MRLCIATPLYPPEAGGPATYTRTLEQGLPTHGDTVIVVKFSGVRHLPKMVRHVQYFFHVLAVARKSDAILALDPVSVGLPAVLAAILLRKPFIVKVVGDYAWEQGVQRSGVEVSLDDFVHMRRVPPFVSLLRTIQTFVARHARAVIVPSEYLKGIVTAWGIDAKKIEVIYNAVSIDTTSLPIRSLAPHTILTAGRLVPWKGIHGLIDALALVRQEIPDATLSIIGDGPERTSLEAHAAEKVSGAVTFLGALSHTETLAHVQAADVFALNSTYEGLSHMLIEATMLGASIVASNAGGNPEVIRHEQDGLIVPTGDSAALAQALTRMLQDTALAQRLGAQANIGSERFALANMLEHTHSFLAQCAYRP